MAKMTLVSDRHPAGHCVLAAVDGDGPFKLFEGIETEVNTKRALCYVGDDEFKIKFEAGELDELSDDELVLPLQLMKLTDVGELKKALGPKKKSTTQKVVETVTAVTSAVTPTTTNDQSSDEADSANESE